jgi:phosphoglycolate phosphatase
VDIDDSLPMNGCKLAIFDFDGTLADSFPFFLSVFNQLAQEYRFKSLGENEVENLRGLAPRQLMQHVGLPAWKLPAVAQKFILLMKEQKQGISPFAGIEEVLHIWIHARSPLPSSRPTPMKMSAA